MKILITISLFFIFITNIYSSVLLLSKDKFTCSDGTNYDVVRHYVGGWGPGRWEQVAFCEYGTLTQESYNGRVYFPIDAHIDIKNCAEANSEEIQKCYSEFIEINTTSGEGAPPKVKNMK